MRKPLVAPAQARSRGEMTLSSSLPPPLTLCALSELCGDFFSSLDQCSQVRLQDSSLWLEIEDMTEQAASKMLNKRDALGMGLRVKPLKK